MQCKEQTRQEAPVLQVPCFDLGQLLPRLWDKGAPCLLVQDPGPCVSVHYQWQQQQENQCQLHSELKAAAGGALDRRPLLRQLSLHDRYLAGAQDGVHVHRIVSDWCSILKPDAFAYCCLIMGEQ